MRRLRPTRRTLSHRANRCGFTLIETITALTLTAIVISIAAAAIGAASDARDGVRQHQATLEAEARWRALVTDMLRHAPSADAVDEPLLRVATTPDENQVTFLSTGVVQPFGTGRIWRVVLRGSPAGVVLDAEPIGRGPQVSALHTTLAHLRLRDIAVREGGANTEGWRSDWPIERSRPALLRLTFVNENGAPAPPLIVSLSPLDGARP